jgi:hypothetical protein
MTVSPMSTRERQQARTASTPILNAGSQLDAGPVLELTTSQTSPSETPLPPSETSMLTIEGPQFTRSGPNPWVHGLLRPRFKTHFQDLPPALPSEMTALLIRLDLGGVVSPAPSEVNVPTRDLKGVSKGLAFIWKVLHGSTHNFALRVSDWTVACMLMVFGSILVGPQQTFQSTNAYAFLAQMASETAWGWLCILVATCRLAALIANGTFDNFRWSPHVRFLAALGTCFLWFQISLGMMLSPVWPTGLAVYPFLFLLDLYNSFLAASEAGVVERRLRYGGC